MLRPVILSLILLTAAPISAAPAKQMDRIRLVSVLTAIDNAAADKSANTMLGTYVRAAIEGAVVAGRRSGKPVICTEPGQGSFDAKEFSAFAQRRFPDRAAQEKTDATPVLIDFVMRQNPCH